ncbi:exopolysaccharide biosynthesis GT4 family glycosyltransferase EpsE [Microcoleus sp. Pol10D4]|uniref:exopolysaccharide biosynthesis GT4 family glycosyltransferase EpsE n=1 Tax=Microcoleus sp. Pol10D4 TaxID=3055387 RepID=UPI002FD126B0
MKAKIGYFIPQFPGQTHIFFWRERQFLAELGIETDLVSTQPPPRAIASHVWAEEAQKNTVYLFPFAAKDFINSVVEVLKAGPAAWWQCLAVIAKASDTSLSQKVRLLALVFVAGKLAGLARTKGWSHIHVHSCATAASIAMFASLLSKVSYSLTLHGPLTDYGPNQEQKWHFSAFAIVITKKLYEEVNKCLAGHLPQKVEIAPMGVDLSRFHRKTPYSAWNGSDACHIFSCGRLNRCKGHADLIAAIDILRKRGFNVELQIAGEDEQGGSGYRLELEKLIEQLGLKSCVSLLGAVSEDTVNESLEKAQVFVLASWHEPLGVAIMEAMAMEMPVVVTGSGGVKELIDDGIDGLLVEPEAPEQLADAIANLLQNPELALSISQESRKKIMAKFSHGRSAETLAQCLEKLGITNPS